MKLEEKGNAYQDECKSLGYTESEMQFSRHDFMEGYRQSNKDIVDFLKANPKATASQIIQFIENV